jgi:hypothetical protein
MLLRTTSTGPEVLTVLLPHLPFTPGLDAHPALPRSRATDGYLAAHTMSVREIERLTGLDLLPRLDRAALKEAVASALWPRN